MKGDLLYILALIVYFIVTTLLKSKKKDAESQESRPQNKRPTTLKEILEEFSGEYQKPAPAPQKTPAPVKTTQTKKKKSTRTEVPSYYSIENEPGLSALKKDKAPIETIEEYETSGIEIDLSSQDEIKKAFIYSEIIKPKYFWEYNLKAFSRGFNEIRKIKFSENIFEKPLKMDILNYLQQIIKQTKQQNIIYE